MYRKLFISYIKCNQVCDPVRDHALSTDWTGPRSRGQPVSTFGSRTLAMTVLRAEVRLRLRSPAVSHLGRGKGKAERCSRKQYLKSGEMTVSSLRVTSDLGEVCSRSKVQHVHIVKDVVTSEPSKKRTAVSRTRSKA